MPEPNMLKRTATALEKRHGYRNRRNVDADASSLLPDTLSVAVAATFPPRFFTVAMHSMSNRQDRNELPPSSRDQEINEPSFFGHNTADWFKYPALFGVQQRRSLIDT
jgi:hypothetical protein